MPDLLAPVRVPPRFLWVPPRVGSYGDEAADLAELAGRPLDPEQRLAVDALLSYSPGGRWAALESAMVEARQNGKTGGVLLPVVLFDLFLLGADRIVWTAHLFKTARDAFADVVAAVKRTPELSRRVKKISYANGEEAVELMTGARLEFLARSKGGGRGIGGKRVVFDEALFLSDEMMGALLPTLSARADPQVMYASSAGVAGSVHLRALRDRGRPGGDPSLTYVEWCAEEGQCAAPRCPHTPGTPGCLLDDEERWLQANHALGVRITYDYVRSERRALPPAEFARERLGWWDDPVDETPKIPLPAWAWCADPRSQITGRLALAWEVSWDRSRSVLAVAGHRADGLPHLEVVEVGDGTAWVPERVAEVVAAHGVDVVAADPTGPGGSLVEDVQGALPDGMEVRQLSARDVAHACGRLFDLVTARPPGVRHLGDDRLVVALRGSAVRELSGSWAWDRKRSRVDVSPLVAVTVALHGLSLLPEPKPTPLVAWI